MFNKGDATGATSGTRTAYNSREPEFILVFLWLMLLNLLFSVCFFVVDVAQSFVHHCLGFCPFFFWSSFSDFLILTTCIYPTISDQKNNAKFQNLNFIISPKFLLKFFTALFEQILQNHDLCFRQC